MDNLTHSLVGALLGQAGLKRKTGLAMPALIIGANLPDIDVSCFFWLDDIEHLGFRRGITHGPPAMLLLPIMLAGLLWGFDRWQDRRGTRPEQRLPVRFRWLFLLSFIACLSHPALDWLNVYGIRLLEPFSSTWFYGDTLFIIDIWLWLLLGFATWFSIWRERRDGQWRQPARIAMVAALAYIAVNAVISAQARATLSEQASRTTLPVIAAPVPLAFWQRQLIYYDGLPNGWTQRPFSLVTGSGSDQPVAPKQCLAYTGGTESAALQGQVKAFRFWSRAFFVEPLADGVVMRDARFYEPRAGGGFSVEIPGARCLDVD